jgi:uncharacterized protein YndB with AHSA1/START domain
MSCNEEDAPAEVDALTVEREAELPAPPEQVWEELSALFDDDDRVRVDDEMEPARRLTFFWAPREGDDPPSYVEIELDAHGDGTLIRIRETRLDGATLSRAVGNARALA